jgi:septin family protein
MKHIIDKNYGADADGNRGITLDYYELELSDEPEVLEKLKDVLEQYSFDDYPKEVMITIEDINFDIIVSDFISQYELWVFFLHLLNDEINSLTTWDDHVEYLQHKYDQLLAKEPK